MNDLFVYFEDYPLLVAYLQIFSPILQVFFFHFVYDPLHCITAFKWSCEFPETFDCLLVTSFDILK